MKVLYSLILIFFAVLPSAISAQIADPSDVSGLVTWVDAQNVNADGTQPNDGDIITTWTDKSSSGNNLSTVAGTVTYQATAIGGINPALRFPPLAQMTGGNPFPANVHGAMTIFFVSVELERRMNFAVSLNGTNTSSNMTDGRFSFHAPWVTGTIFFDAAGCCGASRLSGASPNSVGETTLYTGLNDFPGNRQLLRIDGLAFQADNNGHNANISRGINIGTIPGVEYNGRFAEIVIYDRALTLAEVEDVECYLLAKWKPAAAVSGCLSGITVTKTSSAIDLLGLGAFNLPENDVLYQINVSKTPGAGLSNDSIFIVDSLPDNVSFFTGDIDGTAGPETDPITFSQSGSSLTFTYDDDVAFSNSTTVPDSFEDCGYEPMGVYDSNVRHICINPKGTMQGANSTSSFQIMLRAQVD